MMGSDTIAAIATAVTNSGIGIIRISGDEALHIHFLPLSIYRSIFSVRSLLPSLFREIITWRKGSSRAVEFLTQIFDAMSMTVQIDLEYKAEEKELCINLSGGDMGILIGKRGQTLDSLQYLVPLRQCFPASDLNCRTHSTPESAYPAYSSSHP